jgi:BASS family bile acid:Na+ symporter
MLRGRDLLLVAVVFAGLIFGVFLPQISRYLTPWAFYFMMTILFLSFLRIDFSSLMDVGPRDLVEVGFWCLIKLAIMPLLFWGLAELLIPRYSVAILLLSGVSTGVVAPFMSNLLGANTSRVLHMVVVTSLLVPLTLPAWVKVLMGARIAIPFSHMARMLLMVIFVPMGAVILGRRFAPRLMEEVGRRQFALSLLLFFSINAGIFAPYSAFLRAHAGDVLYGVGLAFSLAGLFMGTGLALGRISRGRWDGYTGAVCLTFINNVLMVVFAGRFFGPEATLVAAFYMVPFFVMLIPMRLVGGSAAGGTECLEGGRGEVFSEGRQP